MESYGRFAGVYDVFMDNVNYREWADYIIETLAQDIDMNSINDLQNLDENNPDFEKLKLAADSVDKLDMAVKDLINEIFGYDISLIVFGTDSCLSPAGGQPIFMNFMQCIFAYINECSVEERKKSQEKLNSYAAQRNTIVKIERLYGGTDR